MKRLEKLFVLSFAVMICLLAQTSYAQTQTNSTPNSSSNEEEKPRFVLVDTRTIEACKSAFNEVRASRPLILAQSKEIEQLQENSKLKDEKIALQTDIISLKTQREKELTAIVDNQSKQLEERETQVANLTKRVDELALKFEKEKAKKFKWAGAGLIIGALLKLLVF